MRFVKVVPIFAATGLTVGMGSLAMGDVLAADNAANYIPGGGWNDLNNNQGSGTPGFTSPWSFASTPGTSYVGLSSLDPSTTQWELQADQNDSSTNVYPYASALRSFPSISAAGGYITLDINADDVDANGFAGVGFYNAANTPQFSLLVQPANPLFLDEDYVIDAGPDTIDTGLPANGDLVHMYLSMLPTGYSVVLQQDGNTVPISIDIGGPTNNISSVNFFDSGSVTPIYFNNLTVVPLPPAAIAAAPLLAMLGLRQIKRRA